MKERIICSKCKKEFILETIEYPTRVEEGRFWDTYYCCPYCGDDTKVHLSTREDVNTYKIEK